MNKEEKNNSYRCPICERPTHKESKYCIFHASAEEKTEEEFKKALKEYVNKIKKEDGDYDFEKFIFIGNINFKKDLSINTFKKTVFEKATFEGGADFEEATFYGDSVFSKATFKGVAGFERATFEGGADFEEATFYGDSVFSKATFKGGAVFMRTTFKGGADFEEATFYGDSVFSKATFKGVAVFMRTTFKGGAGFGEPPIKVNAELLRAIFEEGADFRETTFEEWAYFSKAIFEEGADFRETTFEEYAYFVKATFCREANFGGATFKEDANFWVKSFIKDATFANVSVLPGKKLDLKAVNNKVNVSFERAYLENAYLKLDLGAGTSIDFTDALLRNTKIERDQIENRILQEKKKEFSRAKKVYLLLKNNFHSIGQYKDESWAFTKEKDMERKSTSFYSLLSKYKKYSLFKKILKQSNLLKRIIVRLKILSKWLFSRKAIEWFNLSFSDFIYQYGENPWRVIRFALIIIFLFAVILNFSGIVNSDSTNLIIEFIKKSQDDEYTIRYLGPVLGSFLNCLYFSVVTFTTLGYGDFQPTVGLSRFFVSLESIIGAITMALFVYTFARRTGGR